MGSFIKDKLVGSQTRPQPKLLGTLIHN